MHLKDRVALVTGAGSGIGEASAKLLASHGARVGVLSRTAEEVREVAERIKNDGGEAVALTADISKPPQIKKAIDRLADRWGRLDIVFANAGINGVWAPIEELEPDEWDKTLEVNLKGTFLTVKYATPYLKRNGGSVIITSSVNGNRIFSNTGATAYSCSKAGQVAFTQMIALELAKHRVRVNAICPGAIKTEISESTQHRDLEHLGTPVEFPEGRIPLTRGEPGTSEQVAELVAFLASDQSDHISGAVIYIDGAESVLQG